MSNKKFNSTITKSFDSVPSLFLIHANLPEMDFVTGRVVTAGRRKNRPHEHQALHEIKLLWLCDQFDVIAGRNTTYTREHRV